MNINITKKIEEIRRKPEHIRLRWVWGAVALSMFLIIIVWIFSITLMFQKNEAQQDDASSSITDLKQQLQNTKQAATATAPSLQNFTQEQLQVPQDGTSRTQAAAASSDNSLDTTNMPTSQDYSNYQSADAGGQSSDDNSQ